MGEDVWVLTAMREQAAARARIEAMPPKHPFELRYGQDMPQTAWERCEQVLDRGDIFSTLKRSWEGDTKQPTSCLRRLLSARLLRRIGLRSCFCFVPSFRLGTAI